MTTVIGSLNILDDIIITNEKSVLPFKFKMIYPNEIKLNRNINIVVSDTLCPVLPINSNITVHNVVLEYFNNGVVPNIYTGDAISRRIFKAKSDVALNYNEVNKFPSIFRFSGYYEPMLNEIELFNKSSLSVYNVNFNNAIDTEIKFLSYVSLDNNLTYNIVFDIENINGYLNKCEVNDIIHFAFASDFDFLNFKTAHILNIEYLPANIVRITSSLNFETIPTMLVLNNPLELAVFGYEAKAFLFKVLDKHMTFNYNYANFAMNNNIIISKVYDTINILKTNNAINNVTNRYPMIDEHGVTTVNRNIFKSSWDVDYYYKTISNKIIQT